MVPWLCAVLGLIFFGHYPTGVSLSGHAKTEHAFLQASQSVPNAVCLRYEGGNQGRVSSLWDVQDVAKQVWCLQIGRWGQHIESLVSRTQN